MAESDKTMASVVGQMDGTVAPKPAMESFTKNNSND